MAQEKQNMDHFLRESLGNLELNPSKNVWKGVSKKLILLELLRLNFSNVGKSWLYTGIAAITAFAGFTIYQLNSEASPTESPAITEETILTDTNKSREDEKEASTYKITSEDLDDETHGEMIATLNPYDDIIEEKKSTEASKLHLNDNKSEDRKAHPSEFGISNSDKTENPEDLNKGFSANAKDLTTDEELPQGQVAESSATIVYQETQQKITSSEESYKDNISINNNSELKEESSLEQIPKKVLAPILVEKEKPNKSQEIKNNKSAHLDWFLAVNYSPEWLFSEHDIFNVNQQLGLRAGMAYKEWSMSIGIGLKTEKTASKFMAHYSTIDSVGFFYDIDYYETIPEFPDSIIIHYTIQNIFDSVDNQSIMKGPDQRRKWVFIPIDFSYRIYQKPKYELMAKLSANFGWQYSVEDIKIESSIADYYQIEDISPEISSTYMELGIGLENNFSIMKNWWVYAEPRLSYYAINPYKVAGDASIGPFAFGLQVGIKYKFNK